MTSHGDHYHYYNGKVPYDAIISEELLMKDPNYQLKDSDIVNEIKGGYVIKVDGKYYVYLKDAAHADNIRTKEEIKRQKQEHSSNHGVDSNDKAVVAARAQGRYTTDDGYIFNASDIIEDTGDAYIVPHGNHFHYIPKSNQIGQPTLPNNGLTTPSPSLPVNPDVSHEEHEEDGHGFDANRIIAEDESGFIMSHGNHNHYFFKKDLTADQIKAAQKHLEEVKTSHNGLDSLQSHEQDYSGNAKEMKDLDKKIEEKIAGIMKQYGVKRESIVVNKEKNAIIYPHGDHHHADPIDEHKPVGIGHSHSNYELFKPEEGVAKKEGNKVYTGEELTNVVNLLKNSTFNNQNFTLANGQKRVSFSFPPELEKKLGINMLVKLITPDGKVLEKVSGKVFGEGVGNIANFELDQPYLPGQTFKYTIASKDYPEVSYDGTFTVSTSLAYKMASQTIFYPFHAGDTYLRVNPQFAVPKGTDALVRVFDEFHGNAYLENNYKVGEIKLPIPKLNQGTTRTAGNKIPVTFMANAYLDNQSTYIVEVPILEKENQTDKPSILPQFKRNKAQENSKLDEKVEEPKTSEKVEKEKLTETRNSTSNSTLEEAPAVDPVQEKVEKFTASYGLGLDSVIFNMDGTIELRLPSGEVIKKNLSDLIA
ncbi:pneumococcal histidine triad protein E (Bvh-3) [Streptococcus pneumoniae]|nr:pneumococcal histidine triad protein E (Bvh-3) [Streptococcus pneumoniae]